MSTHWGFERGSPIDRYYIERFLERERTCITGEVLEIGSSRYTKQYGSGVCRSDVLHVAGHQGANVAADLANAPELASNQYDCILITQSLQCIFDLSSAVETIYRILKPEGSVLATFPGISKISRYDMERWGYYWSLTTQSAERLFSKYFGADLTVEAHGNVLTAAAFLYGLASHELTEEELNFNDPDYELLITARATKAPGVES